MISIVTTVDVQPGRERDFEELYRQVHRERDRYPGLRTSRLLRDTDQQGRYVLYEEWDDRDQFDAFVRASGMLWLIDATDHWITPPRWSFFEDVDEVQAT